MKKIEDSEYLTICRLYHEEGKSQPQIAAMYGVSHALIGKIVRNYDDRPTRTGGGQYYPDELEESNRELIELAQAGLSLRAIGLATDLAQSSINERLQKLGIRTKYDHGRWNDLSEREQVFEKIALAYRFGLGLLDIKARLHVSAQTIYKALDAHGVDTRKPGEWAKLRGRTLAAQYKDLYDRGMSYNEIAETLGKSDGGSISTVIKKHFPKHQSRSSSDAQKKKRQRETLLIRKTIMGNKT